MSGLLSARCEEEADVPPSTPRGRLHEGFPPANPVGYVKPASRAGERSQPDEAAALEPIWRCRPFETNLRQNGDESSSLRPSKKATLSSAVVVASVSVLQVFQSAQCLERCYRSSDMAAMETA